MNINKKLLLGSVMAATVTLAGCQSMMSSMGVLPMGSSTDQDDAAHLWATLKHERLVGNGMKSSRIYPGSPPHGKFLQTLHQQVTVDDHTGMVIVKRNYDGPGVSAEAVEANPEKYLKAVTVMFKREAGYDAEDKDWFWAKYQADGSLFTMEKMMMEIPLAGRVAKGKDEGCISCHIGAPGGDFVFAQDINPSS
ncbi:MAG: cytochrome P460 family protein [Gammaproteobacteria bacterium]|nr:cytochrome P460 family protein [Gammaproteobacteria bacterium]